MNQETPTAACRVCDASLEGALDANHSHAMIGSLVQLLDELGQVVQSLSDEQYARKPVGVMPSSIGGHVRHCLDHVSAIASCAHCGRLDYDRRERGTAVESNRWSALEAIGASMTVLRRIPKHALNRPLTMTALVAADAAPIDVVSTLGRELVYVLSHTIHHNAIIGAMVKTLGGWLPPRFGYAPATLAHQNRKELVCVR